MPKTASSALPSDNFADFPDDKSGVETTPLALTAQQAQQWRKKHRPLSLAGALPVQLAVGLVVTLLAWALTGSRGVALSVAYGGLAAALLAALFTLGATSPWRPQVTLVGVSLLRLFIWESVKIVMTIAMLGAAPKLIGPQLDWLALLAGFVLVIKSFWLSLWRQSMR